MNRIRNKKTRFWKLQSQVSNNQQLREAAQGTSLRIFSVVINLATGILLARMLGDEDFGTYLTYIAIGGMISSISSFGLSTLLAREIASARGNQDWARLKPIAILIRAALTLLLLSLIIAFVSGYFLVGIAIAFALANNVLGVASHVFIGFERVLTTQWVNSVIRPIFIVFSVLVAGTASLLTIEFTLAIQAISAILAAIVLWLLWNNNSMAVPRRTELATLHRYKEVVASGATVAVAQVLINGMTQIDILIVAAFREPNEVAWYYAASRAAMIASFFFGSVTKLAEPKLIRLYSSGEMTEVRQLASSTTAIGVVATLLAVIAAFLLSRPYLNLYGPEYVSALPTMIVLLLGQLALSTTGPAQPMLRAMKLESSILLYAGIGVALGTTISIVLIGPLGLIGVAIGSSLQFATFGYLQALRSQKSAKVPTTIWSYGRIGARK
ncbi:MAG: oligosaccharide flippase family protein [Bacteroidota bacterium]